MAMVPNMVAMVNFANAQHSRHFRTSSGSPTRLARTLSSRQNDSSQNMERNIDGPSSLCGSAQSTNTLPHSVAGKHSASLNGGNNPGIGLDISASKVHSTWERSADAPCKKSQQRRRPPQTDAVSCRLLELEAYIASRLLGPNAGTQCWMFAQCDFPICHAHQAEWRVVSRNPSSVRWILARARHAASRTSSHVGTLPCSLLSAIPISPGGNPQNSLLGRPCGTGR